MPEVQQSMAWDDEDASTLYYDPVSRSRVPSLHRVGPAVERARDRTLPPVPGERRLAPSVSTWNVEPASNPLVDFGGLERGARPATGSSKVWVWIAAGCLVAAGLVVRDSLRMASLPIAIEPSPPAGGSPVAERSLPQPAAIEAAQPTSSLSLSSAPSGAAIFVDDVRASQTTPASLTGLAAGEHRIRLEHGSTYHAWEKSVVIPPNQRVHLPSVRLLPLYNPSSSHKSSSEPQQESDVQPAPAPAPAVAPPPRLSPTASGDENGVLRINSLPWADIVIDGRKVGTTPQLNLSLPAGHHSVKLVNKELGMQRGFYVDIAPGQIVTKSIVFD